MPYWLTTDWSLALRVGGLGQLALVAIGAVITAVNLLQQVVTFGLWYVDWGAVVVQPVLVVMSWGGVRTGQALTVTGALYAFLAYRFVSRAYSSSAAPLSGDRVRLLAAGVKIGLVAAGLNVVVAVVLNVAASGVLTRAGAFSVASPDVATLAFYTVVVGTTTGSLALLGAARWSLPDLLGVDIAESSRIRAGLIGALRTLVIGCGGLLALATLGRLLGALGASGLGLRGILGAILATASDLAVLWVDSAVLLFLGAIKFLQGGGYVWHAGGGAAVWMWLAVPILAVSYLAGGSEAARVTNPRNRAEGALSAALVGPIVGVACLPVALGWAGLGYTRGIVFVAILGTSLWGVLALAGAWLWGAQQGLPAGLALSTPVAGDQQGGGGAAWTSPSVATPGNLSAPTPDPGSRDLEPAGPGTGVAAGWYPDPSGGGSQRWWDGSSWTDTVEQGADGSSGDDRETGVPNTGSLARVPTAAPVIVTDADGTRLVRTPPFSFRGSLDEALGKYATFSGRARRSEFWWFALGYAGLMLAALALGAIAPTLGGIVLVVVGAALFLPYLAVATRRLHDTGRSGAWIAWLFLAPQSLQLVGLALIAAEAFGAGLAIASAAVLISGVTGIVGLVLLALPGHPQTNRYGKPPAFELASA